MVAATSMRSHSANFWYWMLRSCIVSFSLISLKSIVSPLRSTMSCRNLPKISPCRFPFAHPHSLFHVYVQLGSALPRNFVEALLFFYSLLIRALAMYDILDILVPRRHRVLSKKLLHRLGLGRLGVVEKGA